MWFIWVLTSDKSDIPSFVSPELIRDEWLDNEREGEEGK